MKSLLFQYSAIIYFTLLLKIELCWFVNYRFMQKYVRCSLLDEINSKKGLLIEFPFLTFYIVCIKTINRGGYLNAAKLKSVFNDPDLVKQWYSVSSKVDTKTNMLSHNLDALWKMNITGNGVTIGIINGGVEWSHRDLIDNYKGDLSFNFIRNSSEIVMSSYGRATEHAGIISAVSNNGICGVGVAPSSKFANLQIFDDEKIFLRESMLVKAMGHMTNSIQIYIIDFFNDYKSMIGKNSKTHFNRILSNAHKHGREKLGNIYVTGSGNFRQIGYDCWLRPYQQRADIFVFAAISYNGLATEYSERCTAILASSLSTFSLTRKHLLYSTTLGNICGDYMGGIATSASISAGIIALTIGHNPNLNSRQVMLLIILTSIQYDVNSIINKAGFSYSYSFGFGMLNANELIELSHSDIIVKIKEQHVCKTLPFVYLIKKSNNYTNWYYFYTSGCLDTTFCITEIEQVFVIFTIPKPITDLVRMRLTSPSGTKFTIIKPKLLSETFKGIYKWRLKVLGYFQERVIGTWILEIETDPHACILARFQLIFYGTCNSPSLNLRIHSNITSFILLRIQIRHSLYARLSNARRENFYLQNYVDIYSFSDRDSALISKLNRLVSQFE